MKELSTKERTIKLQEAEEAYAAFMDVILPGWEKKGALKGTPERIARMYVNELLAGHYGPEPKITVFDNDSKYSGLVFQGNIAVKSMCEHHLMPFFGRAHVGIIPNKHGKIIGLSKINRIVEYYSRREQVQEKLTQQIHDKLKELLPDSRGIAVTLECNHTCVSHRGIQDESTMKTAQMSGLFLDNSMSSRDEFYRMINDLTK